MEVMTLGSHNTMTYLPLQHWWQKPFSWIARCQSRDIQEQYRRGVRLMDLRVAFDKVGHVHFRHGLIAYIGDVEATLSQINAMGNVTVRIVLEKSRDEYDEVLFQYYVRHWAWRYGNITFVCGVRKEGWKQLCGLPQIEDKMLQWCASMQGGKLMSLFPWLWAKLNNRKAPFTRKKLSWIIKDFI